MAILIKKLPDRRKGGRGQGNMLFYARQAGRGEAPMPQAGVRIITALPAD
jgi:hypothetical protein